MLYEVITVWWTWDPRLTISAICLLLYIGYIMLRGAIDSPERQARFAAVYALIAVINVGAATETEMKEKKARVEDALHATRAAVEDVITSYSIHYTKLYEGIVRISLSTGLSSSNRIHSMPKGLVLNPET